MIIKTKFEKENLNKDKDETLLMMSFLDQSKANSKKRKPLNISVAIDISGSMGFPLVSGEGNIPFDYLNAVLATKTRMPSVNNTRLSLAKKSLINILKNLKEDDFISVVSFSSKINVVFEPTQVNSENIESLIIAINNLNASGATDLHAGWFESIKMVSKKYSNTYINRSIILSDGDISCGQRNPNVISQDVLRISEENISTSTFGFGSDFNEDLLQLIANSGGGNSYYVEKIPSFQEQLDVEFSGLINTLGTLVRMEFITSKNVSIENDYNQYQLKDGKYILPNIISSKNVDILFKIKYKTKAKKQFNVGEINLYYQNEDGKDCKISHKVKADLCDDLEWSLLDENKELKIRDIKLTIANDKEKAIKKMDSGDFSGATAILQASSLLASGNASLSADIEKEFESLNDTLKQDISSSNGLFRKNLSYSAYVSKRD
jgi:Ca-activated chloride channel family protein